MKEIEEAKSEKSFRNYREEGYNAFDVRGNGEANMRRTRFLLAL